MKKIIAISSTIAFFFFQSCNEKFDIGDKPSIDQIEYSATSLEDAPGTIHFSFTGKLLSPFWTIEKPDGSYLVSNKRDFTVKYSMAGEYKGAIQAYGQGGLSDSIHFTFNVPENDELVSKLTGLDNQKVWIWDSTKKGHLTGVYTDPLGQWEGQWITEPNELSALKIYDDELSFLPGNNSYLLKANGYVYVESSALSTMDPVNYPNGGSVGVAVAYTQPAEQKWAVYQNDAGKLFLSFSGGGFPSYVASPKALGAEYEIIELTDNTLHLYWKVEAEDVITGWHYHFKVK
jgi:hypothetical protein